MKAKSRLYKVRVYAPFSYDDSRVTLWVGWIAATSNMQAQRLGRLKAGIGKKRPALIEAKCVGQHVQVQSTTLQRAA